MPIIIEKEKLLNIINGITKKVNNMTYAIITFQCIECGVVVRVLIRDNHGLSFDIDSGIHSENQCLTKTRYFKCPICKTVDTTRKFENVFC